MDFDQKRERIMAIDAEMQRLENEKRRLLGELQAACKHASLIEMDGPPNQFGSDPPRRLCLVCGLEEQDWTLRSEKARLRGNPVRRGMEPDAFWPFRKLRPLTAVATVEAAVECRVPVPEGVLP